jgi:hypothetical protein
MKPSVVLVVLILVCASSPLAGQQARTPDLDAIERQLEAHRYSEARRDCARWWEVVGDTVSGERRARALHLRALLAEDLEDAERDLLRIAVEHPHSAFAAGSLFRLAQLHLARGDTAAASTFATRLVRDHPQSAWEERARDFVRSQVDSPAVAVATPPPPRESAAAPAAPAAPAARSVEYVVQVGPFATVAQAEALRDSLRSAGTNVFLARVGGSRATVLRTGPLRDRNAAEALARRLRSAGHQAEVVSTGGS